MFELEQGEVQFDCRFACERFQVVGKDVRDDFTGLLHQLLLFGIRSDGGEFPNAPAQLPNFGERFNDRQSRLRRLRTLQDRRQHV